MQPRFSKRNPSLKNVLTSLFCGFAIRPYSSLNKSRSHGLVRIRVDEDETACYLILRIFIEYQWVGGVDGDFGNIVHLQFRYTLFLLQGVDVAAIVDAANQALGLEGCLTDYVFVSYGSWALIEPAYIQRDVLFDARLLLICLHEGVAT